MRRLYSRLVRLSSSARVLPVAFFVAAAVSAAAPMSGCQSIVDDEPRADVQKENGRILIVDRTGKKWDVTHAVNRYGFVATEFQFGIGPNAIKPIFNPTMLRPGDAGYPPSSQDFIVIGTTIGGDSRSYSIRDLTPHEVVNEQFGDVHVAVGW